MDRLLWYVFAGSRGGATRARIVASIWDTPLNTHQIAQEMAMDYKTIQYNLRVLQKHVYVTQASPDNYGKLWQPSKNLRAAEDEFWGVAAKMNVGKPTNNSTGES